MQLILPLPPGMQNLLAYVIIYSGWYLFYIAGRIVFFLFNLNDAGYKGIGQLWKAYQWGTKLDLSAAAYMSVLSFLMLLLYNLGLSIALRLLKLILILFLGVNVLLILSDALLYREWGNKLEADALRMLMQPEGLLNSIDWWMLPLAAIATGLVTFGMYRLFLYAFKRSKSIEKPDKIAAVLGPVFMALLILPIRGGIGNTPLSISSAYHSTLPFENHLACNTVWNLGFSFTGNSIKTQKYKVSTDERARIIMQDYRLANDSFFSFPLATGKPNIILITLESFTANMSGFFGGGAAAMPHLDKLAKEGISFTRCYASGDRSDEGLASVYLGFPGLPGGSILEIPAKAAKQPNLIQWLKNKGYYTAFLSGTDLDFANLRTIFLNGGIDEIVEEKDYPRGTPKTKWGVYDQVLFNKATQRYRQMDTPFFCGIYTISSHPPYDVKADFGYTTGDVAMFNAFRYSDSCLGRFISDLKQSNLWQNTLVIVTADHGIRQPVNCNVNEPARYHVPLIFTGGVIKHPQKIEQICSQTDIIAGIAYLTGLPETPVQFSKNPFKTQQQPWCAYFYTAGIGVFNGVDTSVYDIAARKITKGSNPYLHQKAKDYLHFLGLQLE